MVLMKMGLVLMIAMMMEDAHYLSAAVCQLRNSRGETITNLSAKCAKNQIADLFCYLRRYSVENYDDDKLNAKDQFQFICSQLDYFIWRQFDRKVLLVQRKVSTFAPWWSEKFNHSFPVM